MPEVDALNAKDNWLKFLHWFQTYVTPTQAGAKKCGRNLWAVVLWVEHCGLKHREVKGSTSFASCNGLL